MIKGKCGFLAIGAYGGNQCVPFYKSGYPCLFVNTAIQDLNSLTEVDENFKYHISGGEGCNKNRDKSKDIFRKDIDNVLAEIKDKLPGIEILFIVGSSGGGTASGILASMKRIAMDQLELTACVIVTVMPNTKTESMKALMNCYTTLTEIEKLEESGCTFILDNDKRTDKMKINDQFFWCLDALLTIESSSVLGNMDDSEIKELLSARGMAIISKLGKDKSNTKQLRSTFYNNVYAPLEDDKVIQYIGLANVGDGKDIQIEEIFADVGNPYDAYVGYDLDATVCMLAGLSLPYTKLGEIKQIIDDGKDTIKRNISSRTQNRLSDADFDFFGEKKPKETPKEKKKNYRDLLF